MEGQKGILRVAAMLLLSLDFLLKSSAVRLHKTNDGDIYHAPACHSAVNPR